MVVEFPGRTKITTEVMRLPLSRFMRSAAVLGCAALLVVAGAPVHTHGQATIETCEDWAEGAPVRCGTTFAQGAPWLIYVFRGMPAGRYLLQRKSAAFTGSPAIATVSGPVSHFALTNARRNLLPTGEYTVTLTDQASGRAVGQGTYDLTPQTPREALAAWAGKPGEFAAMGVALAAWRLNDPAKALELARATAATGQWTVGRIFAYTLVYEIAMAARDYPAAIEAVQSLMDARKAAYAARQEAAPAQPVEYEWLVRAQIAACRLDAAHATITEGLRAFPNTRALTGLTGQLEKARSTCP